MLFFLKKIRKRFIAESRIKNYLLYALGEIVLVVLGILIALWINNTSQNYKLKQKEQGYLKGLETEFMISKQKLDTLIKINQESIDGAQQILSYMDEGQSSISEEEFSALLVTTFAFDIGFNSNNSLLTEIINSGSLKDFSNQQLKLSLTNWLSTMEDIKKQENDQEDQRQAVFDLFRSENYSLRQVLQQAGALGNIQSKSSKPTQNLNLLNSTEFENSLLLFMVSAQSTETAHYLPLRSDIEEILDLLKKEIKE